MTLERDAIPEKPKSGQTQIRRLQPSARLKGRLTETKAASFQLPVTARDLERLPQRPEMQKDADSESASTSSEFRAAKKGGRSREAKMRLKRVLRKTVDSEMGEGVTPLEYHAVTPSVRQRYQHRVAELRKFVEREGLPFTKDVDVDLALVKFFNQAYWRERAVTSGTTRSVT